MSEKVCLRCGRVLPLDNFTPVENNVDGRMGVCRPCAANRTKQWRKRNPEAVAKATEATRRRKVAGKRYPSEALKVRSTPERGTPAWQTRYMWTKRVTSARNNAKRWGAKVNDLRLHDWLAVLDAADGRCFYCHEASDGLTIDHMQPLCRGGDNTKANVVASCWECNMRKARRTVHQFLNNLCENDHPRTDLYTFPSGKQVCRECVRESGRRHRARKLSAKEP